MWNTIGESIECPFRVMDEFDVFMDSVNRNMTLQLLIDTAKMDRKKQFIFVTPNDLRYIYIYKEVLLIFYYLTGRIV